MAHNLALALPPPSPTGPAVLWRVSGVASDDVWAVSAPLVTGQFPLIAHWNDSSWDWDAYVGSPQKGGGKGRFSDVHMTDICAVTAKDVWVVGSVWYANVVGGVWPANFWVSNWDRDWRTLIFHYDGTRIGNDQAFFEAVFSPNASDDYDCLYGVDGHDGAALWAVGWTQIKTPVEHPPRGLAMRRRGSDWELVPTPDLAEAEGYFFRDVAVVDDDDVWAVGAAWKRYPDSVPPPLVMHWDGTDWSEIPTPASGGYGILNAVHALSADDVWAGGSPSGHDWHLVLHWDGSSWQEPPAPQAADQSITLNDIAGEHPDDVWAVGSRADWSQEKTTPFAMNWDGSQWTEIPCPDAPSPSPGVPVGPTYLTGVSAIFGSVIAVGGTPGPMNTWGGDVFAVVGN